ncbi:hypothetical protein, partial [Streptomyces sp. NPDC002587]
METATSLTISQLAGYLRGLTQRLDPGAGWYGEFLRRDPEALRACLDGAAIPPWDVVESLLRDLAEARGEQIAGQETVYAGRLRAAAVTAWDRLPGGLGELRTQYAAAAAQRADAREALRSLTARLGRATDPAEADALARELSWAQDDAARAASRHEDIAARLAALRAGAPGEAVWPGGPQPRPVPSEPQNQPQQSGSPAQTEPQPRPPADVRAWTPAEAQAEVQPQAQAWSQAEGQAQDLPPVEAQARAQAQVQAQDWTLGEAPVEVQAQVQDWSRAEAQAQARSLAEARAAAQARTQSQVQDGSSGEAPAEVQAQAQAQDRAAAGAQAQAPVGRAEGRWLRGARRAGGARYAGSAAPAPTAFTPPPGHPDGDPALGVPHSGSAPRGARFGRPEPGLPAPRGARAVGATGGASTDGDPATRGAGHRLGPASGRGRATRPAEPDGGAMTAARGRTETGPGPGEAAPGADTFPAPPARSTRAVVAELIALRARGRGGEAHALLCEITAWPADRLPGLADQLARAGLAADWATLLWEAGSLPPGRLAAVGPETGREADCDRLL